MYVEGYDYNGQSGEYWNELYTYDKVWNDSSTSNTQKITGINTNNYWIQRYGEDFAPYRAMGWHDDGWRRPNQQRPSGAILIGTPPSESSEGSSPMQYSNGSHPRYFYLGNRYVGTCEHCVRSTGLKTGKAVFISATGATLEYDIQDWTSQNDSKNTGALSSENTASQVYYRKAGTTGTFWNNEERNFWGDCRVFRLTTDPADDGVPAIKKMVVADESIAAGGNANIQRRWEQTNYNILRISGYGVLNPFYNVDWPREAGFASPVGGLGPIETWSGDSGTMQVLRNPNTGEWICTQVANSQSIPDFSNTLRIWTGDTEYETLQQITKPADNHYKLENPIGLGTTGATYTLNLRMISGVSAAGAITAVSESNTAISVFEIPATFSDDIIPLTFDPADQDFIFRNKGGSIPGFGLDDAYEIWVPYESDYYDNNRLINFRIIATDDTSGIAPFTFSGSDLITPKNGSLSLETESGEPVASDTRIIFPTGSIPQQIGISASDMTAYIGTTLTCNLTISDTTGTNIITNDVFVRGFTGTTGPGLTYDFNRNLVQIPITEGTWFDSFSSDQLFAGELVAKWDSAANGIHVRRTIIGPTNTLEANIDFIPARNGETFDIEFRVDSNICWITNDGFVEIGNSIPSLKLKGITYNAVRS